MNSENAVSPIQCDVIAPNALSTIPEEGMLGLLCLGKEAASVTNPLPIQHISTPILSGDDVLLYELWHTSQHCHSGKFQDIAFRATADILFGVIEIDEAALGLNPAESSARAAAESAYQQIFSLLDAKSFTHLWRVWNYLPAIHADECGLERYRQFNRGRHQAFVAHNKPVDSSPAASALGVASGLFSVAFIAGRAEPTRIENPRQVSAFAYPFQYGPRSPAFTRAATVTNGQHETLFISGTASIVGHETVHPGDVIAQTRETIANLSALIEQANARAQAAFYTLKNLTYRVYIRHANDYPQVRAVLDTAIGTSIRAMYVQADICRPDLLIEIEAVASRPPVSDNV